MSRGVVLGVIAGLVAIGAAQAADLPVKAQPIEYVKICANYGAGFFYIPATDTCMKLGGYLRVDTTFNGGIYDQPAWNGDIGQGNRYADYFAARSRMAFNVDTRTATEYGVVRTYGQANVQFSTLGGSSVNPTSLSNGPQAQTLDTPGGGYVSVESLFIQFAGFTFGKSASPYATPWQGYPGNNTSFLLGGHDSVTALPNVQYRTDFANGLSGTIGLVDPVVYDRTSVFNLATGLTSMGTGGNAYAGVHVPDVAGNLRLDQAWGLFQISGSLHEVNASYNNLTAGTAAPTALSEISGHPDTKWGGSAMFALQIKNLPTGPGDDIKLDATAAQGDTKNVIATSITSPSFAMLGAATVPGAYRSVGFGATTDAVYLPVSAGGTGDLKLTRAYGIRGAFNHNWDQHWSSALFGSFSAVRYDGNARDVTTAQGQLCKAYAASNPGAKSANYSCNPNFDVAQLGLLTRWTPLANLAFSAEVLWTHLDQNFTGAAVLAMAAPAPTTAYQFKDQDTYSFNMRVQRNF